MKDTKLNLKNKNILVICESPNKTSHIKEYLQEAGYKNAHVVASAGHISNLQDNRSSYKNSGVFVNEEFRLNIAISDDKKEVVNRLKKQADTADIVYLMTDGDREGEAIAWSLIKFLKLPKTKYVRAVTHEITPKAVVKAIENPVELNDSLVEAAHARMTIDKMVGYGLSPVARTYIGAKSVGRCQSAGLKLICDREHEIQNFIPESYYDLYLSFEKNNTRFKAKYVGTDTLKIDHLKTDLEVRQVKDACWGDYIVRDILKKEKQESPKPPFCTATIQQEAASKLGLKVKDVMSICQKLFEGGYISYHRTDDTTLSDEFVSTLKSYIESNYGDVFTTPRVGKKDENAQEGHEAIRVTDLNLTPEKAINVVCNDLQVKVYKLIWQRTVACALPNAKISETTYNIYNNEQKFILRSNEVTYDGYRAVYTYRDDDADMDAPVRETFSKNEKLDKCSLEDAVKQTQPPARYTEASLIKKLQADEIGRPSTYATIVETVLSESRGYCTLVEKKIVPTERGLQLSAFLDRAFSNVINLNYTRQMEANLDLIATGKLDRVAFLSEFYTDLENAIKSNTEIGQTHDSKICPKCGATMIVRRSKFGKLFYGCSNYPNCHGIININ